MKKTPERGGHDALDLFLKRHEPPLPPPPLKHEERMMARFGQIRGRPPMGPLIRASALAALAATILLSLSLGGGETEDPPVVEILGEVADHYVSDHDEGTESVYLDWQRLAVAVAEN